MKLPKAGFFLLAFLLLTVFSSPVFADNYSKTASIFKQSKAVQPFFKNCYGYAVFPTVGKGGMVVGGAFGKGQVYKHGKRTGKVTLTKLSVGFQLGGQAFSEIIFLQDKRSYDKFTSGDFEFDASVSAVAITVGAQAEIGTGGGSAGASLGPASGVQAKTRYTNGMIVFIHAKGGLMYEASIGGQKFFFTPL
ncbi:MAG: lipid-binding SYLF domain-containing protein [Desulfobacteraceae bacterium]|nr:lipid-binding SYLF domain-containing protein [Desulfobacteraceae bacterium]